MRQVTEAFAYDPVGNRTASHRATGQVSDAANRLLEDSQFVYTYDANGNLTSKTSKATGEVTTFTYDAENQLIGVTRPGMTASYRYDALGRRIEKSVNGVVTRYVYDNEDIIAELDGTNTVRATYVHGPGIDEPLARITAGSGVTSFSHADGLGSLTQLTDSTGTVAQSYTYDSFGTLLAQTGTVTQPYTYTGREFDSETGLYYYRARYYDPSTGRFLQEDPIGFLGGDTNLYGYVFGNPINLVDPYGLESGRYDICRSRPFEPICRRCVDVACNIFHGYCCKVDFDRCILDIDITLEGPAWEIAALQCVAKFPSCGRLGPRPESPEPWSGQDPKGYGNPYPSPPGRGPKVPNQPGRPWQPWSPSK